MSQLSLIGQSGPATAAAPQQADYQLICNGWSQPNEPGWGKGRRLEDKLLLASPRSTEKAVQGSQLAMNEEDSPLAVMEEFHPPSEEGPNSENETEIRANGVGGITEPVEVAAESLHMEEKTQLAELSIGPVGSKVSSIAERDTPNTEASLEIESAAATTAASSSQSPPTPAASEVSDGPPHSTGTPESSCNSAVENTEEHERRTTELIKKQINEIEKEISRRMQNKNVKKIDESELAQLLNDHGFGSFVGAASNHFQEGPQAGISPIDPAKPSLNQLRSSFSPPSVAACNGGSPSHMPLLHPANQSSLYTATAYLQGSPAALMGVLPQSAGFPCDAQQQLLQQPAFAAGHGPAPLFHQHYSPHAAIAHGLPMAGGVPLAYHLDSSQQPQQHHQPRFPPLQTQFSPLYSTAQLNSSSPQPFGQHAFPQMIDQRAVLPQMEELSLDNSSNSSPPLMATPLPPTLSSITPEMAAALLQQLQQQNPHLIASLVDQQQRFHHKDQEHPSSCSSNGSGSNPPNTTAAAPCMNIAAARIPSPPKPQYNISRRGEASANRKVSNHFTGNERRPSHPTVRFEENGWRGDDSCQTKHHPPASKTSSGSSLQSLKEQGPSQLVDGATEKNYVDNGEHDPVWVMRDSYLKRLQRDEMRSKEKTSSSEEVTEEGNKLTEEEEERETDKLLADGSAAAASCSAVPEVKAEASSLTNGSTEAGAKKGNKKEAIIHEPAVLIEGVLFRARYLGSTQLTCDGRPTKASRMAQAQEAVARVKAPEGEIQPSTEIDLFISTEKIMVLNTDLQRISETDVRQDILMDHSLRSVSYIADIGDLVVLMARRMHTGHHCGLTDSSSEEAEEEGIKKAPRIVCHVFESDESAFIAQSIGQAFQVAYVEFLRANGIDDPSYLREIDYQDVLNSQELLGEELEMFARKETQKDVIVSKKVGEPLGIVVVESGWGSMVPTVVIANMAPGGSASRSNQLNIGDQIMGINGISLVGLPLTAAQQNIKNAKSSTAVRLTVVSTPPVVEVRIRRPETRYQLGFSVQNGVICSLLRGGIAERGGIRVGHRIIEINHQSVVAVPHERIVSMLATATGEIHMKTMPTSMFRLLTGQEQPNYI